MFFWIIITSKTWAGRCFKSWLSRAVSYSGITAQGDETSVATPKARFNAGDWFVPVYLYSSKSARSIIEALAALSDNISIRRFWASQR